MSWLPRQFGILTSHNPKVSTACYGDSFTFFIRYLTEIQKERKKPLARLKQIFFFIYNLNQQSEFTFYKLMLCLLQCLDGESSRGESALPQIRLTCHLLLSRLFSSLTSSVVWCLLHFWWMTSCTYDMSRSSCSFALETYHGASTIILRILDWLLWIIDILDLLAQPHNSRPYVQICMIMVL
jgi:hypothetical protein